MTEKAKEKSKKKRSISSFTILLIILIVLALVTVVMSLAGVEGVQGATVANVATAPVKGFTDALPVCLFVLILGGFLGIVTETGALDAGIAALVKKLKGNELILIPILMFIFSIGGTTYGMCEETVPFYLLLAATMVAAGFDSVVGAAVVLLGAGCGVLGSTVNPFAVGAAVDSLSSSGIVINQGTIILLGVVLWLVTLAISIVFVMRYAKKVKANKGSTILSMQELKDAEEAHGKAASEVHKEVKLTGRQKGVLIAFAFTFVVMIVGFIPLADLNEGVANFFDAGAVYDADGNAVVQGWSALITGLPIGQWYFDEASTWFFLMAVLIGIIGGLSEKQIVNTFITGAADMMSVVLVIALARGISVLMANTGLDVFVLDAAANALAGLSGVIFAPMSFLVYFGLSFLIPSTSGMATVSMPIMGPLAVKLGFSPEVMVMIFSAAIGVVNLFTPTSGAIMGGLALAKIEWTTWLKFALKLIVALSVVCAIILTVACVLI